MKVAEAIEEARRAAAALRSEFPDAEADADLWDGCLESMTDALDVADWLVNRSLDRAALAEVAAQRAEELRQRAARFARAAKGAKAAALAIYEAAGIRKRERAEWTVSIRAGAASVIITDAAALPAAMLRHHDPEPDKTAIKAALAAGQPIPGAVLGNNPPFLNVRTR